MKKEIPRGFILDAECQLDPESIRRKIIEIKYNSEPTKSSVFKDIPQRVVDENYRKWFISNFGGNEDYKEMPSM